MAIIEVTQSADEQKVGFLVWKLVLKSDSKPLPRLRT
jgi:hypothetical protein